MNYRDRVIQALNFQESAVLPYTLPIEPEIIQMLNQHFGSPRWQNSVHNHIGLVRMPALSLPESDQDQINDLFGSTWRTDHKPAHLTHPVLSQPTLDGYRFPSVDDFWDEALLQAQIDLAKQHGQFIVATTGLGLFERSWALRGFENALTDMLLHADFYHALLDEILYLQIQYIKRLGNLDIDAILFSDDWGDQRGVIMGPRLWRKFFKPRAEKFFSAVHSVHKWTIQHSCGNVFPILGEMVEIGLDVLESVQPEVMDIYEIKRQYGSQLSLWGGLGTQRLLPFGSPQEILEEVSRLRNQIGRGGGYILSPAKPILPEVPLENVLAVLQAFDVQVSV
jgi:uroporphyrinogen decarboxylase